MSSEFSGRQVVVTGGTGALGTAVVSQLLEAGATCHVPCFFERELETFPHQDHQQVHLTPNIDLTDEDTVADFYASVPNLWASIQVAGGFDMSPFAETGMGVYESLMNLNVKTCFLCCREAVRRIRDRDLPPGHSPGGRLVNVAARPALEPRLGGGMVVYTMSKAAVAALTQSLSEELAEEGIWVNAVAPSILDTPANRRAMPNADHSRWPNLDDVAATLVFLASPANRTSRGGLIPVYGAS